MERCLHKLKLDPQVNWREQGQLGAGGAVGYNVFDVQVDVVM